MGNSTPARSSQQFPLIPVITLFGFLAITLTVLLQSQASVMPNLVQPTVTTRPTQTPVTPTTIPPTLPPTPEGAAAAANYDPAQVNAGFNIIAATCSACHGMNARGIQGLGKDLLDSPYVDSLIDEELVVFIQTGRQPFDPLNTTGVLMPPSGGNPALTANDLMNVVAYLRVNAVHPERIGAAVESTAEAAVEVTAEVPAGTPTTYSLPIDRFNIGGGSDATATPEATATTYVLPIDRFGARAATATPGQ